MFDLEKAIATWRRTLEQQRGLSAEDVEELDGHVRDVVRAQVARGEDVEAAFEAALQRVGTYAEVEVEYRKVYWAKLKHRGRLGQALRQEAVLLQRELRLTLRHLRRERSYTVLNVAGLAVGIACCVLILLYVRHERSYDAYHPAAERTYRVAAEHRTPDAVRTTALTPPILAATLARDLPEVETATRLWRDRTGPMAVRHEDATFFEPRVLFADANVFDVLAIPLLAGDPETALAAPHTVVLTETTARKYFGDADPMGETLLVREPADRDWFAYRVTGVARDVPANTHAPFDVLASYASQRSSRAETWLGFDAYTYVVLREDTRPAMLEARLPAMVPRYAVPQLVDRFGTRDAAAGYGFRYVLQPIQQIHLHSHLEDEIEPNGNALYVTLFGVVAVFILLLAGVNFVNLATARALRRAREVGIRKVLGCRREQLVRQFLGESVVLSGAALVLGLGLVVLAWPAFQALAGRALALSVLGERDVVVALLAGTLGVGLLAGLYPALVLSGLRPLAVLKGPGPAGGARSPLRNGLVVFQFAVALFLALGTAVVYRQVDYMRSADPGFDAEAVVVIEGAEVLGPQGEAFRQALRALPGVVSASNAEQAPGRALARAPFHLADASPDVVHPMAYTYTSFDYVETLGMRLVAGRTLSRAFPTDSLAVLLNEMAVRALGVDDPIGKQLVWPGESTYTIVGVVEDFHYASLEETVGPVALLGPDPRNRNRPNLLTLARLRTDDLPATLAAMERTWNAFTPGQRFTYTFLDQDVEALYRDDRRTAALAGVFSALALFVACLGLFGLAAYAATRRTREIGIRKVLGATATEITALLSKDFLRLVLVAFLLAAPLAYLAMSRWLAGFAYPVDLRWLEFLLVGSGAIVVTLATVGVQAVRAALADPVKSLRSE